MYQNTGEITQGVCPLIDLSPRMYMEQEGLGTDSQPISNGWTSLIIITKNHWRSFGKEESISRV